MKNEKTKVVHSQSKSAWNVVEDIWGAEYKIARIPYFASDDYDIVSTKNKHETLLHAQFVSGTFNQAWHNEKEKR